MLAQARGAAAQTMRDIQRNIRLLDILHGWNLTVQLQRLQDTQEELSEERACRIQERKEYFRTISARDQRSRRTAEFWYAKVAQKALLVVLHAWQRSARSQRAARHTSDERKELEFHREVHTFTTTHAFASRSRALVKRYASLMDLHETSRFLEMWKSARHELRAERQQRLLKEKMRGETAVLQRHIHNLCNDKISLFLRWKRSLDLSQIGHYFSGWLRVHTIDLARRSNKVSLREADREVKLANEKGGYQAAEVAITAAQIIQRHMQVGTRRRVLAAWLRFCAQESEMRLRRDFSGRLEQAERHGQRRLWTATSAAGARQAQLRGLTIMRRSFCTWYTNVVKARTQQRVDDMAKASSIASSYAVSVMEVMALKHGELFEHHVAGRCIAQWRLLTRDASLRRLAGAREEMATRLYEDDCADAVRVFSQRLARTKVQVICNVAAYGRLLMEAPFLRWRIGFLLAMLELKASQDKDHEDQLSAMARLRQAELRESADATKRRHLEHVLQVEAMRSFSAWATHALSVRQKRETEVSNDLRWGLHIEMRRNQILRLIETAQYKRLLVTTFSAWKQERFDAASIELEDRCKLFVDDAISRWKRTRDHFLKTHMDDMDRNETAWVAHSLLEAWHHEVELSKLRRWKNEDVRRITTDMEREAREYSRDIVVHVCDNRWIMQDAYLDQVLLVCCLQSWAHASLSAARVRSGEDMRKMEEDVKVATEVMEGKLGKSRDGVARFVKASGRRHWRWRCFCAWRVASRTTKQQTMTALEEARKNFKTAQRSTLEAICSDGQKSAGYSGPFEDDATELLVHALFQRWQLAIVDRIAPRIERELEAAIAEERQQERAALTVSAQRSLDALEGKIAGECNRYLLRFTHAAWASHVAERNVHRRRSEDTKRQMSKMRDDMDKRREEYVALGTSLVKSFGLDQQRLKLRCAFVGWQREVVVIRLGRRLDNRWHEKNMLQDTLHASQEDSKHKVQSFIDGRMVDLETRLGRCTWKMLAHLCFRVWSAGTLLQRQRRVDHNEAAATRKSLEKELSEVHEDLLLRKMKEPALQLMISNLADCCLAAWGFAGVCHYLGIWKMRTFMKKERARREKRLDEMELEFIEKGRKTQKDYVEYIRRHQCKALSPYFTRDRMWFKNVFMVWYRTSSLNAAKTLIAHQSKLEAEARTAHAHAMNHMREKVTWTREALVVRRQLDRTRALVRRALLLWLVQTREVRAANAQGLASAECEQRLRREVEARAAAEEEARRKADRRLSSRPLQNIGTQTDEGMSEFYDDPAKLAALSMEPWASRVERFGTPAGDSRAARMLRALRFVARRPLTSALLNLLTYEPPSYRRRRGRPTVDFDEGGTGGPQALPAPMGAEGSQPSARSGVGGSTPVMGSRAQTRSPMGSGRSTSPPRRAGREASRDPDIDLEDLGRRALERLTQLRQSLADAEVAVANAGATVESPATSNLPDPWAHGPRSPSRSSAVRQSLTRAAGGRSATRFADSEDDASPSPPASPLPYPGASGSLGELARPVIPGHPEEVPWLASPISGGMEPDLGLAVAADEYDPMKKRSSLIETVDLQVSLETMTAHMQQMDAMGLGLGQAGRET
eukprot:TRINITY_DN21370_c1_g1_i1.p1 TRINITY_DN21370_c1_g1~~TRINITY_DN21370_c1_g1_i1.p1  ORF type:complete len:1595 (-),score=381.83 TRINITY_DN21370_c1_g1_i1:152-4936(-)